jgi:oxygen-independent coproporphyrinogen III oxidase
VSPADWNRIAAALDFVPRAAYSVPHVYPTAAQDYTPTPKAARPGAAGDVLRLYVHVPFCRYHCSFCYFAVRVGGDDSMERYVGGLLRELEWTRPGMRLTQLFVGGGTPTSLPPALLDRLLGAIFARTPSDGSGVHTVETSPETVTAEHLDVIELHGVGRVSMGVQSLHGDVLESVNRRHGKDQALAACALAERTNLILNVDLIYGLPGQTEEGFVEDMRTLAAAGVPSLTLYSLRMNERTTVGRALGRRDRLDLARLVRWRSIVWAEAEALGYTQTRWHTFKRLDSHAARHERLPCFDEEHGGYQLGIGMSARSHLGHAVFRNHDRIPEYLRRIEAGESPVEQTFPLLEEDRVTQYVARSLGDGKPLVRRDYEASFGRPIERDFGDLLRSFAEAGLLADDGERLTLTREGRLVHDLVTIGFYPKRAQDWLAAREGTAAFAVRETAAAGA